MKLPDSNDDNNLNIEETLTSENLVLFKIPPHQNSLYLSVAKALHFPLADFQKLYYKACNFLYKAISENTLNDKLEMFKGDKFKFREYCLNPTDPRYDNINLETLSQSNKVAIHVYEVNAAENISVKIYNNRYHEKIRLYRWPKGHFDVLYLKETFQNIEMIDQILWDTVMSVSNKGEKKQDTPSKEFKTS